MYIIGLTGESGAGKSTFGSIFLDRGFAHIDCDKLARAVTEPGEPALSELCGYFGEEILFPDGTLDRKKLASIAFSSKENTSALNAITHKHILKKLEAGLSDASNAGFIGCIIDAPTLFQAGVEKYCDTTVALLANKETRIKRVMERDGIDREAAEKRFAAQLSEEFFTEHCDAVIRNNGTLEEFTADIIEFYDTLKERGAFDK